MTEDAPYRSDRERGASAMHTKFTRRQTANQRKGSMDTIADQLTDQLRELGVVRGVLVRMAQSGQIIELRCEMPKCYCHKGRSYFERRSPPQRRNWAPSADHYPQLKADGGKLDPWNVRLGHVLCNQEDFVWRGRIRRMLKDGMSLEEIAESLTSKGIRRPHGSAKWTASAVRKAFVS